MTAPKLKLSSVTAVLACIFGLCCLVYGCWAIYGPVGWIIGGLLLAVISLIVARETLEPDEPR